MIQVAVYKNGVPHNLISGTPDTLLANLQRFQGLSSPLAVYSVRQMKPAVGHMGDVPDYDPEQVVIIQSADTVTQVTALLSASDGEG